MADQYRRLKTSLSIPTLLILLIVIACSAGAWFTSAVQAQTEGPLLSIDNVVIPAGQAMVEVTVNLDPNGAEITALQFSLDTDPACLSMPGDLTYAKGNPDFVIYGQEDGKTFYVSYDELDTTGEIDIAIADQVLPLELLAAGELMKFSFAVDCGPEPGQASITIPILFATTPAVNYGNPAGEEVPGGSEPGSVTINAPPTATPTNIPTDIPTDIPTNTPTNTPTATPTHTPTATPTKTPTNTPTATPKVTPAALSEKIALPIVRRLSQ